jgi:hypothetical protein
MISKSRRRAIAFVAAMGLALPVAGMGVVSPAFAIDSNSPALTGGGSLGYNRDVQTLRLKHHPAKQHVEHNQEHNESAK